MKMFKFVCGASFLTLQMLPSCFASDASSTVKYTVTNFKKTEKKNAVATILIEKVNVDWLKDDANSQKKNINKNLEAAAKKFETDARKCGSWAQGHPWGYELKFEKIYETKDYLSVVFARSTVCAGSPDIEKEVKNFSKNTGQEVSSVKLVSDLAPSIKDGVSVGVTGLIKLNDEASDRLIEDSQEVMKNNFDKKCSFFLKTTSYRVWAKDGDLVFFPEFVQPDSYCQKEYFVTFDK
ncbi:hypothetical protein BCF11_5073 [Collimonas sp. PA-H2]|uniref:hypothetical protein n=1 Tax=Collimonas sp. PA-H2 TaxID=1881062 RepID=UPI000BFA5979|nr:hypothetical protein [Collimonas sp. PA-H2]PFH12587.1 hypothetical protein BCF11_5073 [Collimonas sp. PA-H2]